jgi:hypothetical protein
VTRPVPDSPRGTPYGTGDAATQVVTALEEASLPR